MKYYKILIEDKIKFIFSKIYLILLLSLLFVSITCPQNYNIISYGATSDSLKLSTKAIQKAVDECNFNGGGRVVVPVGTYLTGTITLKDNVELHLAKGATLLASYSHDDFPRQKQPEYRSQKDIGGWYSLIYAEGVNDIAITGLGTIDGQGAKQDPRRYEAGGDKDGRPRNILFISCTDINIKDITLKNSGLWNQHYLNCEDVIVDGIRVYNHSNRNNDGIDIDGCRRFILTNSIFDCSDDAICLKSTGPAITEDVTISNCIASSFANGIKMGTESTGGFRNVSIINCVVKPSIESHLPKGNLYRTGITGLSLMIVDGGALEGVSVSNLTIDGTQCPIYIRLGGRSRKHTPESPVPKIGVVRNITINNVTAYNSGNFACSVTGIPGHKIENVRLDNINIVQKGGLKDGEYLATIDDVKEDIKGYPQPTSWKNLPASGFFIRHVNDISITNFSIAAQEFDPRPLFIADDVNRLRIENVNIGENCVQDNEVIKRNVTNAIIEF